MKVIQTIGVSLILLLLVMACDNPITGEGSFGVSGNPAGNVIIKIAGSDGRTVLPVAPVFSKYELTLQKDGEDPIAVEDVSGITGAGVGVSLTEGNWTISLNAYQNVTGLGDVLAAKGSAVIEVSKSERKKTVSIALNLLTIGDYTDPGVFGYTVILPDVDTATLSLKDSGGSAVDGYDALDLTIEGNLSGSIALAPGYYDLSVILTKSGQSAGTFESVHIYSGLESPVTLDLSAIEFSGKVYIAGTLGGVRLGTVIITTDAAGSNAIETLVLDAAPAVRSANWFIDIPSAYAGTTVYAVQEFNGVKSTPAAIANLPINGTAGVALSLAPATPPIFNVAAWYSALTASGGADSLAQAADNATNTYWQSERDDDGDVWLVADFGFNVSVNAARLIFYADSETGSVLINEYDVQYWNGVSEWVTLINRKQALKGSTDASVEYGDFFGQTVTAQKFRWKVPAASVENAPALAEFGLYKTYGRTELSDAIPLAQQNYHNTQVSASGGSDIQEIDLWVTAGDKQTYQAAIDAAKAVCDNLFSTDQDILNAKNTLAAATTTFNNAKHWGNLDDIVVNQFNVQDGYADKFVITWLREPTYIYRLRMATTLGNNADWEEIAAFQRISGSTGARMFTHEVTGIGSGQTRYFALQASKINSQTGQEVVGMNVAASGAKVTMGVPALSLVNNGPSYRTISLSWTAAQKADAYRIVYSIAGDATSPHALEAAISELTPIAGGYAYSFQPDGFNNPQITGRKIDIYVEALNNALYEARNCEKAEITTTSNTVETRLVGPAELSTTATQATTPNNIAVSWNAVEGAGGYYVFRRQFNLNNNGLESNDTVKYYVSAGSGTPAVTGYGIAAGNANTTTVKATAAVANNRFTLTDTYMSDTEYSGTYNGYAAYYKNQQNELAWGYPYRYFVVPVIAETDTVTFNASGNTIAYTIGDIAYNNAASFEKTGFTVGFAQDVTATKGTGGNQIQITWGLTPMAASANFTASSLRLYRRAYDGTEWSYEQVNGSTHTDSEGAQTVRGVVYEYTVGINGFNAPHTFSRYMERYRAQVDGKGIPHAYGFMLEMVKLQGVSRQEIKVENEFAEDITLIKNGNPYYNRGIDGYTVYVMNRNINANWHTIADNVAASPSTGATQVVRVTTGQGTADGRDLLRVMRDYKHYFKVRSYVLNEGGERVYCPDPDWNFETLFAANRNNQDNANFLQTDYVKWGARQITQTEFAKIASLTIAWGIHNAAGNQRSSWWGTTESWKTTSNNGSSGRAGRDHNGSTIWWLYFDKYKPDLDTRANKDNWTYSTTFLTINKNGTDAYGKNNICARTTVSYQYPQWYGRADGDYGRDFCDVTGPACVDPLYTGQLRYNGTTSSSGFTWTGGTIEVKYPTSAAAVLITGGGRDNTPLPFQSQSEDRRTANDEWY